MAGSPALHRRSKIGWSVLLACLIIETLLLIWVVFITLNVAIGTPVGAAQNYSLVVISAICLGWLVITLLGSARSRMSWVRGSAVTIHLLLFAAGTGCLQLQIGPASLGFGLVALAVVGFFAAIIAKPVLVSAFTGFDESNPAESSNPR